MSIQEINNILGIVLGIVGGIKYIPIVKIFIKKLYRGKFEFVSDAFSEATKILESAPSGSEFFALNVMIPWPSNILSVKKYIQAHINVMSNGVRVTRIHSIPRIPWLCHNLKLKNCLINEVGDQEKWHKLYMTARIYVGEKPIIDHALLVVNNRPQIAVIWIYDPTHPRTKPPGFIVEDKEILHILWNHVKSIDESELKTLSEFQEEKPDYFNMN